MSNSLRLGQTTVNASSGAVVSSQHTAKGKHVVSLISFPPAVQRVGIVHAGVNIAKQPKLRKAVRCLSATSNQFLGSRVGARGAHVGRGLELERVASNGSKWSAGTWLDNKYEFLTPCSFFQILLLLHCQIQGLKYRCFLWFDRWLCVPCRASVDADISVADAWELWNDREKIPRWMKWIDTVTVHNQPE